MCLLLVRQHRGDDPHATTMADLSTTKKKLPFKPTALRNARPKPAPSSSTEDDLLQASAAAGHHGGRSDDEDDEEDTLALFRRAKEMAPIVEADRERRMRRQQQKQQQQEEQEAQRRRASAGSKHSLVEGEDAGRAEMATTPTPTATQASSSLAEDVIMATQEEDNR